ncbi:MAG: hypothetical protein JSS96_00010 [Bacteroidetes bacterium]|nr:hypothetical protein [Bacteroidota bacterium]
MQLVKLGIVAMVACFCSCQQSETPVILNQVVIHDTIRLPSSLSSTLPTSTSSKIDSMSFYKERINSVRRHGSALAELVKMYQNGKRLRQ